MENYLEYYYKKYPNSGIQDYFKLIYQATFGPAHIVDDPLDSLRNLKTEISNLDFVDFHEDLYNYISYDYVRINLRVYKMYNLNVNLLNESFLNTANMYLDNNKLFKDEIAALKKFLLKKNLPIEELDYYIEEFKKTHKNVHHSASYRSEYKPAYRIVHQNFLNEELQYYQARHYLESFDKSKINFIALEGKAASGKTTIANLLERESDITTIHVDDFFDTENREVGINSLRIVKEIISKASLNQPLKYMSFDCKTSTFKEKTIPNVSPIVLIEGVYSSNSDLEEYYQGIMYLHINEEKQNTRLIKRNKLLYHKFIHEWIPKENQYFQKYNPILKANIII